MRTTKVGLSAAVVAPVFNRRFCLRTIDRSIARWRQHTNRKPRRRLSREPNLASCRAVNWKHKNTRRKLSKSAPISARTSSPTRGGCALNLVRRTACRRVGRTAQVVVLLQQLTIPAMLPAPAGTRRAAMPPVPVPDERSPSQFYCSLVGRTQWTRKPTRSFTHPWLRLLHLSRLLAMTRAARLSATRQSVHSAA